MATAAMRTAASSRLWRFRVDPARFPRVPAYAPGVPGARVRIAPRGKDLGAQLPSMSIASAMASPPLSIPSTGRVVARMPDSMLERVAIGSACALILIAPFEALDPIVRLPGQTLTSVEVPLLVALACYLAVAWRERVRFWRSPFTAPWIAVIVVSTAAALLAPVERINALHMTARFALAGVVCLVANTAAITERGRRALMAAAMLSGVVVATMVVLDYLRVPAVTGWLRLFRTNTAMVGGQLRASGPLQYPTIASMVLEIAFALTLGLLPAAITERRIGYSLALAGALVLIAEGVTLTFTRSGLLTLLASLLIVGGTWAARHGVDRIVLSVAAVAVVASAEVALVRPLELMRLRFTSESQEYWFRADFDAPKTLTLRTGEIVRVPLRVTNAGRLTWSSDAQPPILLSYHWLKTDGDHVVEWEGDRSGFPGAVSSGSTVSVEARVRAPNEPGEFLLQWDIEQQHQRWFSTEPDASIAVTRATVTGPVVDGPAVIRGGRAPRAPSRRGRVVLWSAAARMLADHPWLGVGPDNFRLHYGTYIGTEADPRVHSNNMFVELLAGSGLLGLCAWGWFSWRAARAFVSAWWAGTGTRLGISAAGAAIVMHGLADSFLSFTVTYVLFAMCLGLAAPATTDGAHAHRV
jgi:O-antigen ligase